MLLSTVPTRRQVACGHFDRIALQLWEKFRPGQTPPSTLGASRDFNVDMVPKFIMANGNLVKVSCVAMRGCLSPVASQVATCYIDTGCVQSSSMSPKARQGWSSTVCPVMTALLVVDQVLIKTDVTKYLEFKAVDGSFVLNGPRIEKVPITGMEAFRSPLMGLFEKRRAAKFFRHAG